MGTAACTVHLDNQAVKSCLVLAMTVQGREVVTLDGITSQRGLHPIQQAFYEKARPSADTAHPAW